MKIKILGSSCPRCKVLYDNVSEAVEALGLDAELMRVEDIVEIMKYKLIKPPGLVINEELITGGRLLSVEQAKKLLIQNQPNEIN